MQQHVIVPILYDLSSEEGWKRITNRLEKIPHALNLTPWNSHVINEIINEALDRNIVHDTLPEFVKGIEKIEGSKEYFNKIDKPYPFTQDVSIDWQTGVAVEFPWKTEGRFVILPQKEAFLFLTTSRNQLLIPDKAQEAFKTVRVGFAGAGVGSSLLEGVVRAGVQHIVVADGGDISFHDLNRLQSPTVSSIGMNHAVHAAQKALEANPFLTISSYAKNLDEKTTDDTFAIDAFLEQTDIVFEEVDNLRVKLAIREKAREKKIPIIMATDIGFGTVIEFQEGTSSVPVFPLLSAFEKQQLRNDVPLSAQEKTAIAIKMVGKEATYWSEGIKKGLTFWPQTGAAADVSKAKSVETLVSYVLEKTIPQKQTYL